MNKYSKLALELYTENYNFGAFWLVENSTNLIYLKIPPFWKGWGGGEEIVK